VRTLADLDQSFYGTGDGAPDEISCPPLTSVIVATHNRATELSVTLEALRVQETDFPYEIIVVDNNSSDETKALTLDLAGRDGRVRYTFVPTQGLALARNAGVAAACGEIIVFADDDVTAAAGWLAAIVATYRTHVDAWCVGGKIVLALPERELPAWFDSRLAFYLCGLDLGDTVVRRQYPDDVWGGNFSVKRDTLRRVGLFNPRLGIRGNRKMAAEETELVWRIQKAGGSVYYSGEATVVHRVSYSRLHRAFFRRRAYWHGRSYGLLRLDDAQHTWRSLATRVGRVAKTWMKSRLLRARVDNGLAFQDELSLWLDIGYVHQRLLREQLGQAPTLNAASSMVAVPESAWSASPPG
jgi:GT2 family glycosyltransferase